MFVAASDAPSVVVYGLDGRRLSEIAIPVEARSIGKREIDLLIEQQVKNRPAGEAALIRRLTSEKPHPEILPYFGQLVLDEWGQLWVQEFVLPDDEPRTRWHVLSQAGTRMGVVEMPAGLGIYSIDEDGVLGMMLGEYDQPVVMYYEFTQLPSQIARPLAQCRVE